MKDKDAHILAEMYDTIAGVDTQSILFNESNEEYAKLMIEGYQELEDELGAQNTVLLVQFVTKDMVPGANEKDINDKAESILERIKRTVTSPMVVRTLIQYKELPAATRLVSLYKILYND